MGSYSVYCGISNMTIHEGDEVLLLPLEKSNKNCGSNDSWKISTFPIFGSYNDYGEIGHIKKDFNTALIEEEYKCTIEKFCVCLTGNYFSNEQGGLEKEKAEKINSLSYMWIRKDVWDFMIGYSPEGFGRGGSLDFGNKKILEQLGFEYVGENKNDTRDKLLYRYGKQYFKSDGTYLSCCPKSGKTLTKTIISNGKKIKCLSEKSKSIYNLATLKEVLPDLDVSFFENKEKQHLLSFLDDFGLTMQYFSSLFNIEYHQYLGLQMLSLIRKITITEAINYKGLEKEYLIPNILKRYIELLSDNNSEALYVLSSLITLKYNCNIFSKLFEPYICCITPQCGEDEAHLNILKGFVKILEKNINREEE